MNASSSGHHLLPGADGHKAVFHRHVENRPLTGREGRLDLHAAAVSPDPDVPGVLIVGPKGAGKSSLTIALALSGWTLF